MALSLLLVEDNATTRENILQILEQSPYHVTVAIDGLDGLNQAKRKSFDLVLIDHKMPLMDGILLIKNLRSEEQYEHTPLLLMTTSDPEQVSAKAKRFGADLVLGKPLNADLLLFQLRQFTRACVVA